MNSACSQHSRAHTRAPRLAALFMAVIVILIPGITTASAAESANAPPIANFIDVAEKSWLDHVQRLRRERHEEIHY